MLMSFLAVIESDDDRRLFEKLYSSYKDKLYYIAFGMLSDEKLSEDAVHDTYMKVIDHIDKFYDISEKHTQNLIILILKNTVRDMLKKKKAEPVPFDEEEYQAKYNLVFNENYSFEVSEIKKCLNSLDEKYRTVLELKYWHGMKEKEIADILGISAKAANTRIFRARQMLMKILMNREEDLL